MAVYLIQGGALQGSLPVPAELSPKGILLVNYETPGEDPFAIGAGSDAGAPFPPSYPIDPAPDCAMSFEAGALSASIVMGWSNLLTDLALKEIQIRYTYVPTPTLGDPRMLLRIAGVGTMERTLPVGMPEPLAMRVVDGSYQLLDSTGTVRVDITPTDLQDLMDDNSAEWPDGSPMVYDASTIVPLGFAATSVDSLNAQSAHTDGGDAMVDVIYDGAEMAPSEFWTDFYLASEE